MFGRKKPQEPPLRREVVLELVRLGMVESDASDRNIDSDEFEAAKNAFDRARRTATRAEVSAAFEALTRNGY
ncbi:hypothetical protein [Actinoplanes sp. NPDC051851]|uniref:hypothetical protein n=1 Tax=Actinoplanes sp. NPDC051851 TaxID=3154753 RepID=UPI00341EBE2A